MEQNSKLKLFISYSHEDNLDEQPYIEQFKTHIALLKDNGLIEEWYDREILPGKDYQKEIDNNWKIINITTKGIIYISFFILLYLTIKYIFEGLLYGFF